MKRVYFLIVFTLILGTTSLYSQIFWGPKGSLQGYKTVFFDKETKDTLDSKIRLGFNLGAFVNVPLKNHYSLTAEISYVRRGRKTVIKTDQSDITFIEKYNFLEVPMLLRREFEVVIVENMKSAWHIEIGPNISYWLGGKGEFKNIAEPFSYEIRFEEPTPTTDDVMFIENPNRFLFGLELGVGINLQTRAREFVSIDLRYTHGQTYLGKKDSQPVLSNGNNFIQFQENINTNYLKANYRVFSIDVAYNFMLDVREFKKGQSISDKKPKVKKKRRR